MSALATGVNKKRKKSETKPQAQINKCNNEKRRREQENIYIEELAELISANFADMSSLSVKPDKCAILQETVNQIRSIKQRESASQSCDPVQQGEVSSSRPTILSNEVYGPLLLEALEGFLFVVNAEGKVEHVTENVSNYIKFTRDEIFGNSIYNFIHLGDHTRFSANLMPMTIGWGSETTSTRSRSFSVRFLVKPPDDQDETVEEKQQRVSCYELMHISSTQLRDQVTVTEDESGDSGPYLLCVASRISHRDKASSGIEQFTTKLDTSGKIIGVDVSGVSAQYSQFINKELVDRSLRDLVPQQEVHKLNAHLRDTINVGQSTSAVYRLQIGPDKCVQVQTKSKLFKTNPHTTTDTDFIMATHSIVSEYDAIGPSDPGGGGTSSVGGPLMTSVVNGTRNGTAPVSSGSDSSTASSNALMNTGNASSFTTYTIDNDFSFDIFPTSTFDLEPSGWTEPRPDSRQSATPVSTPTPRPPSNPAYSPATTVAQSPLASFVTQPSPSTPAAPNPYTSTFPFSPLSEQNYSVTEEPKDTKANVLDEASTMMAESGRLRNLLTKPSAVADSSANDADGRNKNRILKGLLNQQDEDDNRNDNRTSPRGGHINRGSVAGPSELPKTSSGGGNNMLLQLLNERSDDDDNLEARAGVRKKSELLHQLLKTESRDNEDEKKNDVQSNEDSLLRSLGFTSSPSPPNGEAGRNRKRPSDDRDDPVSGKRSSDGSQVSSTGTSTGSKLCERNKMLASLLAKTPNNQQPIPHIPVSILSATPQDGLPRISLPDTAKTTKTMPTRSTTSVAQQQQQQRTVVKNTLPDMSRMGGGRQPNTNYLNTMLTHPNSIHHQRTTNNQQLGQVDSGSYTSPATSSTDGNIDTQMWADNNNVHSNDPLLSDILDQVMDIVPDEVGRTFTPGGGQQADNYQNELSEKMAINIIQKSLMQCESVVKSPSSPTISLPGTPPAYTPAPISTQNNQMRPFQPPPNYPQANFISKQRISVRPGTPQYAVASNHQFLIQQRKQQEDRRRLLQQQQQQELLIPSNATAAEINSGLQNIDSLLNNTVAPNVSLQRSASLPESQLSPNYGGQVNQQNQRTNSQQPYSPHSQLVSPIGQQPGFPQTSAANYQQAGARLSPQFNQQLSLRQAYPQGNTQGQNWQQSPQARLSMQNPMLNAQLTRAPNQPQQAQQQQQQQQQQRSLNSPGTVTSRHSPYQQDSFPPPTSPNSAAFNQNQYLRLQRANSVPTATTQLPGGLGSPRPYGREHHPHPTYTPLPPNPHQHPMMYQQDSSQYCYDQTGLQLAYNGADRGRAPPHLQAGVSASGPTSEFVRQELRAVVGARTGQAQTAPNRTQSQLLNQQQVDLEALGLTFELPTTGASDSPKLWGAMGSDMRDMGSMSPQPATSRSSMEEARPGDHSNKSSLLQKLLSE